MKRLLERLQPLKAAVKSIFFISITVLVVIELVRLKRTITLESLESALSGLSIWHLVLMAVIGLVAVSPMLFYDIILNKELETDYSKSYILETSWAVNTINNLAGFVVCGELLPQLHLLLSSDVLYGDGSPYCCFMALSSLSWWGP